MIIRWDLKQWVSLKASSTSDTSQHGRKYLWKDVDAGLQNALSVPAANPIIPQTPCCIRTIHSLDFSGFKTAKSAQIHLLEMVKEGLEEALADKIIMRSRVLTYARLASRN